MENSIGFEYIQGGKTKTKDIDLLDLSTSTNISALAATIAAGEPLITEKVLPQLVESLSKLQKKLYDSSNHRYSKYRTLRAHLLPLTNVAFNRNGKECLTGSYDRTCKLWNIDSGKEVFTLEGHKNVVYAVSFNIPFCDKILTGSFDKTARLWSAKTGECYYALWGHNAEVVAVQFSPQSLLVGTSSMDNTARLYDVTTGQEVANFRGHTAEVITLQFSNDGNQIITGSFDGTVRMWDIHTLKQIGVLIGHREEISNCLFNFDCSLIASSSMDKTAKIWEPRSMACLATIMGHHDEVMLQNLLPSSNCTHMPYNSRQEHYVFEMCMATVDKVLDIAFDYKSHLLATASGDSTARIWDVHSDFKLLAVMEGHKEEVSKVCFSPAGTQLMTASLDNTARLWNVDTGEYVQILEGHTDDVFSCAYSYNGEFIITASKDNTCRIWH